MVLDGSGCGHVYITRSVSDRLMLSLLVHKLSVFNMKQTAVVFEAKMQSAGSAIDLTSTSCADTACARRENERDEVAKKGGK